MLFDVDFVPVYEVSVPVLRSGCRTSLQVKSNALSALGYLSSTNSIRGRIRAEDDALYV